MDRSQSKIILGENHPDTLKLMFNLGLTNSALGKLDEDRRCIVLGTDHVDTFSCV